MGTTVSYRSTVVCPPVAISEYRTTDHGWNRMIFSTKTNAVGGVTSSLLVACRCLTDVGRCETIGAIKYIHMTDDLHAETDRRHVLRRTHSHAHDRGPEDTNWGVVGVGVVRDTHKLDLTGERDRTTVKRAETPSGLQPLPSPPRRPALRRGHSPARARHMLLLSFPPPSTMCPAPVTRYLTAEYVIMSLVYIYIYNSYLYTATTFIVRREYIKTCAD